MSSVITCPRCKGKGEIVEIDWFYGVLTAGLGLLSDLSNPYTCPSCNGKGYIRIDDYED